MKDELNLADQLIEQLKRHGLDYSAHRTKLATEIWFNGLYAGNDDVTVHFDDLPDIRVIQEDHYDQHMDDEDKPSWDDMICSKPEYTWLDN